MLGPDQVEELMTIVHAMDRSVLTDRLLHFNGRFRVDFTTDFLGRQSVDRLRHLFLALCLQQGRIPVEVDELAA